MSEASPTILSYATTNRLEPRRQWKTAFYFVLAWYGFFGVCFLAYYFQSDMRYLGPFRARFGLNGLVRLAVEVTQTPIIRPLVVLLGLAACVGFRRAYLGLGHVRLLKVTTVVIAGLLVVRIAGDVYVTWFADIELIASGRPYRFMAFWGSEWAIWDICVCLFLSPTLVIVAAFGLAKNRFTKRIMSRIESNPDVCGGAACIARTRIAVWILEQARRQGICESELLRAYPSLAPEDLDAAWAYARVHSVEMDEQIRENENA